MKITLILGSVREGRQGIRAAKFIENHLIKRKHSVTVVDPLEVKLPLMNKTYKSYKKGKAPKKLQKLSKLFKSTDVFVIVTAEYNHSAPPALTNVLDYFLEEYYFRPSAIVSYSSGGFGGVRAAVHLRDMMSELGMPSIPTNFAIPKIQDSLDEKGNAIEEKLNENVKKFLDEIDWYGNALKVARKKGIPY